MSTGISFDYSFANKFLAAKELDYMAPQVELAHDLLHQRKGPGNEYSGWLDWPLAFDQAEFKRIKFTAEKIREKADVLLVIGVGGSYLGARSAIEFLQHTFYNRMERDRRQGPEIYFAGQNLSSAYLAHLLELVKDRSTFVNVVSKSGTTLEPAVAFRIFRQLLEEKYGKAGARERIIATTDRATGALKKLAEEEGYQTFTVPGHIGGRYSVLTPVGLLPIAASGINIDEIMKGACQGLELYGQRELDKNPSYQYAALRNIFYHKGKTIELLAAYEPALTYFAEWWKQLFGESEGKDRKGLFPASANFTTDLHSLGQYIQEGRRDLFVTTLWVEEPQEELVVPALGDDADGLGYLEGKSLHFINSKAAEGTILAHTEGGVPNLKITIPRVTPYYYGQLVYFFEKACALSGYLLGVNPFDQPGVEAYKKNMFKLLGKPE